MDSKMREITCEARSFWMLFASRRHIEPVRCLWSFYRSLKRNKVKRETQQHTEHGLALL